MPNGDTARKAALAAMLAVWHVRVAGGVQSSPQAHCEALLDAALTGLNSVRPSDWPTAAVNVDG